MSRRVERAEPNSVRRWNEYAVITALRARSPQRISELTSVTGLTPAPLGDLLRGLRAKNWVDSRDPEPGGMGRPAQLYELRRQEGHVLGLDLGGHTARCVLTDLEGDVTRRAERRWSAAHDVPACVDDVRAIVDDVRADTEGPVWLTGIAMTGYVDPDGELVASDALPAWTGTWPTDVLSGVLPSRSLVINDVRAAAIAEHQVGAAQGIDDFFLIQLGRRPTLGLVIQGAPRRGAHNSAGDVLRRQPERDATGEHWLDPWADDEDPFGAMVRAAASGEPGAVAAVIEEVRSLTPSVAFAAAVVDPEVAVVGGAMAVAADQFCEDLETAIFGQGRARPSLLLSPLDEYAAAHGAALLACTTLSRTLANATAGARPFTLEEFASHPLPQV